MTKDAAKLKKDIETNEVLIPLKESLEQELEEEVDKLESHNNELDKILEYYRKLGVDIEVLKKDIEIKAETVKAVREIKHKEEDCEDETHIFE